MGKKASKTKAKSATQMQIAKHLDCSQPDVSKLVAKGIIPRGATLDEARTAYIRHQRAVSAQWQSEDGKVDRTLEAALLDRTKRQQLEMANAIQRAELLPMQAVVDAITFQNATIKTRLLSIEARLKAQHPELDIKVIADLAKLRDEILNELANVRFPTSISETARRYFQDLHAAAQTNGHPMG